MKRKKTRLRFIQCLLFSFGSNIISFPRVRYSVFRAIQATIGCHDNGLQPRTRKYRNRPKLDFLFIASVFGRLLLHFRLHEASRCARAYSTKLRDKQQIRNQNINRLDDIQRLAFYYMAYGLSNGVCYLPAR